MLLADRPASLKWQGDYTLPRFRAKLANQYLLHPDVAPGYEETYRSDLQKTTISRKDYAASYGDLAYTLRSTQSSPLGGSSFVTQMGLGSSNFSGSLSRNPSGTSLTALTDASGSGLGRSSSVPTLGLRRMEAFPAAVRLGKNAEMERLRSEGKLPTSPGLSLSQMSPEERKEKEKEQNTDQMSRRLWSAAHGSEIHIKEFIELRKDDPSLQLKTCPVPGMQKAMKAGAKLDWQNPEWDGATLFMKAVRTNSQALAEYVLAMGADPNIVDRAGRSVFHWTAMEGNPDLMEFLLTSIPDPQLQVPDNGGDMPLHLAAYQGHLPIIRLLIRYKVDAMQPNALGFNAIDLAEARKMWHITHYLSELKHQEEDKGCPDNEFQVRNLVRPCNLRRANELRDIAALNPKPKPKAAPKKK